MNCQAHDCMVSVCVCMMVIYEVMEREKFHVKIACAHPFRPLSIQMLLRNIVKCKSININGSSWWAYWSMRNQYSHGQFSEREMEFKTRIRGRGKKYWKEQTRSWNRKFRSKHTQKYLTALAFVLQLSDFPVSIEF